MPHWCLDQRRSVVYISNSYVLCGTFLNLFNLLCCRPRSLKHSYTCVQHTNTLLSVSVAAGTVVLLAISLLSPFFHYIPKTALSAIIIAAVLPMVDIRIVHRIFKSEVGRRAYLYCTQFMCV